MDYLDFDIEIGVGSGRDYPVAVIHSAGGEARETMHFPFDELALESRLKDVQIALLRSSSKRRQIQAPEELAVEDFGRALFVALFTGEVRSRYAVSQREAFHQGKGLRVRLRIRAPELASLPWEFLYDVNQSEYLCLSSNTPVVRYLELPQPPQPLLVTPPLSILGMASSPTNLAELDIAREKLRLETALKDLQTNGLVKLHWLEGRTWYHLQRAMRRGPWHIFHFIGHGDFDTTSDEGLIALEDEEGKAHLLSATHLGRLLTDHRSLRLIVLNSCLGARGSERDIFSSTAAILVRRGVPAVMAMQYEITDRAAIELSRTFYEALADGLPVDTAVSEARKAISIGIARTVEWGIPVLYMRSPDGVLFHLTHRPSLQPDASVLEGEASQSSPGRPFIDERREAVSQSLPLTPREADSGDHGHEEPTTGPHSERRMEDFALIHTIEANPGFFNWVRSVAISPDGQTLANGSDFGKIRLWNLHSRELLRTLDTGSFFNEVNSVVFSPDGRFVACGSENKMIKLWGLPGGELVLTLSGHAGKVESIVFSPDGRLLVSGSEDKTIKAWNLSSGGLVYTLSGHTEGVQSVAISPDGQFLASGSSDQTIKLWDLSSGLLVRTLSGHEWAVTSIVFSPDGQFLASGSIDKTIRLWNLPGGELVCILSEHTAGVQSVAISPDGQFLASGSNDETIRLWNLPGGELVRTLSGHEGPVESIVFSPDGQLLVSGSEDQTIKIWGKK